ncbi:MAG: Hydrolase [Nitrospira sp.]|nr:HAD family hydrolase [Nitrospira sp.]ULA59903.1 MAG: Hydrolase [Nitrospira sp.]
MTNHDVVFLLDVDNTLLDADQVTTDLGRYLDETMGHARQQRYWNLFKQLRDELGYADYLGALQRYRIEYSHDPHILMVSHFLLNYPFSSRLFPDALAVVNHMKQRGSVVLVSDGDAVFQPHKIERAGLFDAVDGQVLIYMHKEQELDDIEARYPAEHYVLVDDKLRILSAVKNLWGPRVTTVFSQQGHYAQSLHVREAYPAADTSFERISDLLQCDLELLFATPPVV